MKQAGIKLAPVPGIPLSLMKIMVWIPLPISSFVLKSRIKSYSKLPVLGSTLQSIKRGKNTEIDYLNGEIVKLGKKNGIPTPANSLIVELVHQTETTGKFLTVDELTKQLG
jgi:2-dehydropantoate 2-reductase